MKEKYIQNDNVSMLIKFGAKENLESLQKGCLYMNNLLYFIGLEKESSIDSDGQGDMYEGQLIRHDVTVVLCDPDTQKTLAQMDAKMSATDFGYQRYPVFCMFTLDSRNLVAEKTEEGKLTKSYRFTEEQVAHILKNFGDHALMISNADEFICRVKNGFKANNIPAWITGLVQYYEPNDFNYLKDVFNDHFGATFWKRKKFAFQQEFRILALKKVDKFLQVDVGDIGDISTLLRTKELLNCQIDIVFDV